MCNNNVKFMNQSYNTYCSKKCSSNDPDVCIKKIETTMKKFGAEWYTQTEEYQYRSKATCIEKYGVEYAMQNPKIFENQVKSSYKRKEYIFPSGRIEYVQGYEPEAIDELLKQFDEDDIIISGEEMPVIWYYDDNKKRRYHPDIYIKSKNLIIEVKSIWTYNLHYNKNILKYNECLNNGYNFLFYFGK
jgi:hypothetical protein